MGIPLRKNNVPKHHLGNSAILRVAASPRLRDKISSPYTAILHPICIF